MKSKPFISNIAYKWLKTQNEIRLVYNCDSNVFHKITCMVVFGRYCRSYHGDNDQRAIDERSKGRVTYSY